MTGLEELINDSSIPHIPKSTMKELFAKAIKDYNGSRRQLTIFNEEIAELINVVCDNVINDRTDYIHTCEELADVTLSLYHFMYQFGLSKSRLDKIKIGKKPKMIIPMCIKDLTSAQQLICKILRGKCLTTDTYKLYVVCNYINQSIYSIKTYYKIKNKDIEKILDIKFNRMMMRLASGQWG